MSIKCCNGCKPPKRSPTCHSTCPEYAEQSKAHTDKKKSDRETKEMVNAIFDYKISNIRYNKRKKK